MLNGATYKAAKVQKAFATEITYEDYKDVANRFNNREEFEKTMLEDDEKESVAYVYGAYTAKTTQCLTPKGSNN